MLHLVAAFAWVGMSNVVFADGLREADITHLVQALQFRVPKGWTVSYEKDLHVIDVTRDARTIIDFIAPGLSGEQPGKYENFQFFMWAMPLVSASEFQRMRLDNQKQKKKLMVLTNAFARHQPFMASRGQMVP
jgi:hypothetical protein